MAEIIDIRKRLRRAAAAAQGDGISLRVRICGPDLHWLGVVGGMLAGALLDEGITTAFADVEGATCSSPMFDLVAGAAAKPGLLIAGADLAAIALGGCDRRTVLLARQIGGQAPEPFPGLQLLLPLSDPAPAPLTLAAGCAGGAARLLGFGWRSLEQALRQELLLSEPVEPCLIAAFEAYHRLAPWAGAVATTAQE